MASHQQVLFAETIAAMKKAVKRKAYESDSDSEIEHNTNRGQKLKKRARFVRGGQLAPPNGPAVYKEVVDHAGFQRAIISRNPPLVDEDGYEVDSEDDDERVRDAIAAAAELNPYADIRLEDVLAPLTAVTYLPRHPTLSRPFTSYALTELTDQGRELMQKESAALWRIKTLLTRLCGDLTWAPCGMMEGPNDSELFTNEYAALLLGSLQKGSSKAGSAMVASPQVNGEASSSNSNHHHPGANGDNDKPADVSGPANKEPQADGDDLSMADAEAAKEVPGDAPPTDKPGDADESSGPEPEAGEDKDANGGPTPAFDDANKEGGLKPATESDKMAEPSDDNKTTAKEKGGEDDTKMEDAGASDGEQQVDAGATTSSSIGHAGRATGQNASRAMSMASDSVDELLIHPLFLAPKAAHPDRDLGLPEQEAEDVRRLLQLYVQKQEEVCRGTERLYKGLLRADRLRKTVLKWSKAEAHAGVNRDMSDGEDWYDKEEWGLTEDLKKGQDEEEEEPTIQSTKKTRNRR